MCPPLHALKHLEHIRYINYNLKHPSNNLQKYTIFNPNPNYILYFYSLIFHLIYRNVLIQNCYFVPTFPFIIWVCGKSIIDWPDNLIHALNVSDARVEFGVDEEDALNHLPVCFTAIGQHLILIGWIEVQRLARRTDLYTERTRWEIEAWYGEPNLNLTTCELGDLVLLYLYI